MYMFKYIYILCMFLYIKRVTYFIFKMKKSHVLVFETLVVLAQMFNMFK